MKDFHGINIKKKKLPPAAEGSETIGHTLTIEVEM